MIKKIFRTLFNIYATMCLGLWLLIPIANLFILRWVMHEETGVKTDYWKRPLGYGIYGQWHKEQEKKK